MWGQAFDLMTEYALILNFITLYHGILSPIFVPQMVMCHGTLLFQQARFGVYFMLPESKMRALEIWTPSVNSIGEFYR